MAGAEYCVKAPRTLSRRGTLRIAEGEIVGTSPYGRDAAAAIRGPYLGRYTVYETKSPEGWALDTEEHLIDIESQGQTVPVVVENLTLADEATALRLLKVSAHDPDAVLEGAVFRIHEVITEESGEGIEYKDAEGGFDGEYTTDENGIIAIDHLPHGLFLIEEIQAPAGYVIDLEAQPIAFEVDDQGFIGLAEEGAQFSDTLEVAIPNVPIKLDISKTDLTTGVELEGASLVLADKDGNVVDEWVSTTEPHRISGIAPGTYSLTETIAPEGYLLSKETVTVTVEATGEVQKAKMDNDYTKVDISKTDIANGKEIEGAKLTILDKDGNAVAEWTTDGAPHRINGLASGDYVLREVAAPDGYEVAEDVGFTVEETGEVQKVEMKDARTPGTPGTPFDKTGVDLAPVFALIAAGIAVAGGLIGYGAHKRRKSKKEEEAGDGDLIRKLRH